MSSNLTESNMVKPWAHQIARPMFALSLLFLVLLAALVVVFIDIPRVAELQALNAADAGTTDLSKEHLRSIALRDSSAKIGRILFWSLLALWPLFWLEYVITHRKNSRSGISRENGIIRLLACFVPPIRLATPSASMNGQIWLPIVHWQTPGKTLSRNLEHQFSKPMLLIALLILPILLIEFGLHSLVERTFWLRITLHVCTGFIWCAFAIEFIVMINATDRKLAYAKKNWIDLAIILLPLISFLRSFRVLRLAKLAKLQQLAKMGRVYRMKGLMTKLLKALMLLEVIHRLLKVTPEKKLRKLKTEYEHKTEELEVLKVEIERLEKESQASINSET